MDVASKAYEACQQERQNLKTEAQNRSAAPRLLHKKIAHLAHPRPAPSSSKRRYSVHIKLTRKGFSSRSAGRPFLPVRIVSIEIAALTAGGARLPGVYSAVAERPLTRGTCGEGKAGARPKGWGHAVVSARLSRAAEAAWAPCKQPATSHCCRQLLRHGQTLTAGSASYLGSLSSRCASSASSAGEVAP